MLKLALFMLMKSTFQKIYPTIKWRIIPRRWTFFYYRSNDYVPFSPSNFTAGLSVYTRNLLNK